MNYLKHYDKLIERAKCRTLDSYTEKHHIIPRCVGGTNELENLVEITPEEHFLAHQLLVKIYPLLPELVMAVRYMCYGNIKNGKRTNNKMFGWLRRRHAEVMREINTGRKQSDETIQKRADTLRGRINGPLSKESIEKRTATRKLKGSGKVRKPRNNDSRIKASQLSLSRPYLKCPHCPMESRNVNNMNRYHFDNCKFIRTN